MASNYDDVSKPQSPAAPSEEPRQRITWADLRKLKEAGLGPVKVERVMWGDEQLYPKPAERDGVQRLAEPEPATGSEPKK